MCSSNDSRTALQPPPRLSSLTAVAWRLLRTARTTWPDSPPLSVGRALRWWLRKLGHLHTLHDWHIDPSNPALREMLAYRPSIVNAAVRPYIDATWPAERRLDVIAQHYRLLRGPLRFLRFAPDKQVVLARVTADATSVDVVLDKAPWFAHEGELVLSLFKDGQRLYSLAFTLGSDSGGKFVYAGALQGASGDDVLATYRELTHALHGLRPRDLLFTAFCYLCEELQLLFIRAVGDERSACRSSYFGARPVVSSYDAVWLEHDGTLNDDGFYDLVPEAKRRQDDAIPPRKRAQYRRRYAMLDALRAQMQAALAEQRAAADSAPTEPQTASSPRLPHLFERRDLTAVLAVVLADFLLDFQEFLKLQV